MRIFAAGGADMRKISMKMVLYWLFTAILPDTNCRLWRWSQPATGVLTRPGY